MYVALEGIDTAGKSTQIQRLKKREELKHAIFTFEPGATLLGEQIRKILFEQSTPLSAQTEMLLFLADRAEHCAQILKPNLHKTIISDRSLISGIAYAKNFDFKTLESFNRFATDNIFPDKVILLELSEKELKKRLENKQQDSIEKRGISYLLELQARLQEAIRFLNIESLILDANLPQDTITAKIIEFIECVV